MEPTDMTAFEAWSFKTLSRTANGVQHYRDVPEAYYVYDDKVKNSRHVKIGDLAVIQDSDYFFGAGWIDSIEVSAQEKIRYRCPPCKETDIKERTTKAGLLVLWLPHGIRCPCQRKLERRDVHGELFPHLRMV
jgi:hypothetical protein